MSWEVKYLAKVIPEADLLFEQLKELAWQRLLWEPTNSYLPRLCCSNIESIPVLGNHLVQLVEGLIYQHLATTIKVENIFGNYYRDGNDYLPDHSDQYGDLHVVSLSFGATRLFRFKVNNKVVQPKYNLSHGDIIMFSAKHNQITKHGIPKQKQVKEPRINLTCFCKLISGKPYT